MSETVLKDIGLYKNKIILSLLKSKDFCNAMFVDEEITDEKIDNLVYTQVFPYLYVDETQKEVLPYVCCEIKIPHIPNESVKHMQVIFWIYSHKSCMKYSLKDYVGTRVDILSDIIERQLHDSKDFGIGKIELKSIGNVFPNYKYYGRELIFDVSDFKTKGVRC